MDSNMTASLEPEVTGVKRRKGISGSTLKLVAIITMLIDHTAATILDRTLVVRGIRNLNASDVQAIQEFYIKNGLIYFTDSIMRLIGRLSFPIFCFLLVEGFTHTRSKWKYAARLAAFALISEIPFDLAFHGEVFYMNYQNVFFTLLIGLLVMIGFRAVGDIVKDKKWLPVLSVLGAIGAGCFVTLAINGVLQYVSYFLNAYGNNSITISKSVIIVLGVILSIISLVVYGVMIKKSSLQTASVRFADLAVLFAGMVLAEVLKTDYSAFGVLTIAVMYGLRKKPVKSMLGGCITLTIMSLSEATSFIDLIIIRFYNGTRGMNLKYVFYLFYPVHLLILYMICYFMKIL